MRKNNRMKENKYRVPLDEPIPDGHIPQALADEFIAWAKRETKVDTIGQSSGERPVFVTDFPGAYGLAGFVVTVNGSPVRYVANVFANRHALTTNGTVSGWVSYQGGNARKAYFGECGKAGKANSARAAWIKDWYLRVRAASGV